MLLNLAVFLLEASPWLRRLIWRCWYGRLAKKFTAGDWTFMNYGFTAARAGEPDPTAPALSEADEADRLCIQLYDRVADPCDFSGLQVLEVGSGRGGGASFLTRYRQPIRYTGVDFSPQAVALCRRRHAAVPNLVFTTGDAEALPFPDASFDVVVNVESSHCYGHIDRFFAEAARVLRPGGWFLYTDFRTTADMADLERRLTLQPWTLVDREDITTGVADAMQADDERKRRLIAEHIPRRLQPLFGEFAGLVGGKIYAAFRARDMVYHRFAFRKREPASS